MKKLRKIIDVHCHLHEYNDEDIKSISMLGIDIVAVSDDYHSSLRTLAISESYSWVIPALGIHPWNVTSDSINEFNKLLELVTKIKNKVKIFGEVGLDKKFKAHTFAHQLRIFKSFIDLAIEIRAVLNIHAAGAWKEVIDIIMKSDIPSAIIHWYTGPVELLKDLVEREFYISVNPAIAIQEKHREIVAKAPLSIILIESDAPYNYRGLIMHPGKVYEIIKHIAEIKNMKYEEVFEIILDNYEKLRRFIL